MDRRHLLFLTIRVVLVSLGPLGPTSTAEFLFPLGIIFRFIFFIHLCYISLERLWESFVVFASDRSEQTTYYLQITDGRDDTLLSQMDLISFCVNENLISESIYSATVFHLIHWWMLIHL